VLTELHNLGGILKGMAVASWQKPFGRQLLDPKEQAKAVGRKEMMKSKNVRSDQTEARRAAKHQQRIEAREESLACPAPVCKMITLREWCVPEMKEASNFSLILEYSRNTNSLEVRLLLVTIHIGGILLNSGDSV
jgi:hypothetical protein